MENQLLKAVQIVEQQLDAEIEKLENLDETELERIRRTRIEAMKNAEKQKSEWQQQGHGSYSELADEKDFFETCKKSTHVVCHFYRDSTFRCKILDKHLEQIARNHIECKFVKINAERSQFLSDRLRIKVIPTIALIRENKPIDYIVGFSDLGNTDDFDTEVLEWRIARSGIIDYQGDLVNPPQNTTKKHIHTKAKTIRGSRKNDDDDDSDDDW